MKWIKASERIWEYGKPTIVRCDGKVYMETAHNVIYYLPKEEIEWLDESQASDKDEEVLQQEFENAVAICADNNIEIERLKGLIEEIFFKFGGDRFFKWQQFKTENNL